MSIRMAMVKPVTERDVTSGMAASLIATQIIMMRRTARKLISEKQRS
jgi:hypothetical protein